MKFYEVVLYNVPIEINNDIEMRLKAQYRDILSAKRIMKYPDQTPTSFIRVRTLNLESKLNFLRYGCRLGTVYYRAQPSRKRRNPRRCYRCQKIGSHLARDCPNVIKCMTCSGQHSFQDCVSQNVKCANCTGLHAANSTLCPQWREQIQLRKRCDGVATQQDLRSCMDEINNSISEKVERVLKQIDAVKESVSDLKRLIVTRISDSEPGTNTTKTPDMTWDDCDISAPYHQPDEPSDVDPDLPNLVGNTARFSATAEFAPTPSVETTDRLNPECDASTLPGLDSVDLSCNVATSLLAVPPQHELVHNVNSEAKFEFENETETKMVMENETETEMVMENETEIETVNENETVILSDANLVDATDVNKDTSVEPCEGDTPDSSESDEDATYRDFFVRMRKRTEKEIIKFQNHYNPFMGEILFQYSSGTIGKIITVMAMDGGYSSVSPCGLSIKAVKNLPTELITCCPFHHLSSEIRDTTDRNDLLNSLKGWRTKDTRPFCETWQTPFFRAMEVQYGQLEV